MACGDNIPDASGFQTRTQTRTWTISLLAAALILHVSSAGFARSPADCRDWLRDRFWEDATALQVRACLNSGKSASEQEFAFGQTPLLLAATHGTSEAVRALLEAGADPNAGDFLNVTPLHVTALKSRIDAFRELIRFGANPNAQDLRSRTPLHLAAAGGHAAMVKELIRVGAEPNGRSMQTPLHLAARRGDTETVTALLHAGANLNARNGLGYMPVHYAKHRNPQVLELLVEAGADPESPIISPRSNR